MKKLLTILLPVLILATTPLPARELTVPSVLNLLTARYEEINNYHCTIENYEKSGRKTMSRTIDYYFMKPDCIYVKVIKGKNQGSTAMYRDNKVKAFMGGILSVFKIVFEPTDKKVLSLRGHRINESGWGHSLEFIDKIIGLNWTSTITSAPEENTNQWLLELSTETAGNPSMLLRYMIDPREKLITAVEYYENGELLSKTGYKSIEINVELDRKIFE